MINTSVYVQNYSYLFGFSFMPIGVNDSIAMRTLLWIVDQPGFVTVRT